MMPTPDTDLAKALAILAEAPDPAAWAVVLHGAGPAMEALARRLTGDGELARDAVQEALLQIRDCAGAFRAPAADASRAALSWILRVAANTALVLRRREMRIQRRERMVAMLTADHSQAVDRGLAAHELAERMRTELAALPEPTRAAIVLRHCSGLAFADVATALGIPEGTAKIRVHRGLAVLRERLVRAGFACSLLAVSGLLQQLPASETPVPFTGTSAAHRLLTTKATSSVAFLHQGSSMTTLASLATAASVLLVGSLGVLLSQDATIPPPPVPVTSPPADAAPLVNHDSDPGVIAKTPPLVHQAPGVARLDTEVSFHLVGLDLVDVAAFLGHAFGYPVEVDAEVLVAGPRPVTINVEKIPLSIAVDLIAKHAGVGVKILPDRIRLIQEPAPQVLQPDASPAIPTAPQ